MTCLKKYNHIFGIGEAGRFKFYVLIDTQQYWFMRDYPQKRCVKESRALFIFWEISDNISETVQDGDIVAMED